jgi:predicted HicB family RNase H-like nuclease
MRKSNHFSEQQRIVCCHCGKTFSNTLDVENGYCLDCEIKDLRAEMTAKQNQSYNQFVSRSLASAFNF